MDNTKTGLFIASIRKQKNMTQKDIAGKLHIGATIRSGPYGTTSYFGSSIRGFVLQNKHIKG